MIRPHIQISYYIEGQEGSKQVEIYWKRNASRYNTNLEYHF